jgi:hypothetical protein
MFHRGYHVWEYASTSTQNHDWNFPLYYRVRVLCFSASFFDLRGPTKGSVINQILLSFNLLSIPILPLSKASMLLLLLRVGKVLVPIRRFLYLTFVFNILAAAIPWVLFIFICPPASGNGSKPTTFGGLQCLDRYEQGSLLLFVNCANLLTDVLIFPVPFFIMRELMNTNWRSKLTIILTFATSLWYV